MTPTWIRRARFGFVFAILVTTSVGGCLRRRFDLCAQAPPHPECPLDASANGDAPSNDAASDETDGPDAAPSGADAER